MLIIIAAPFSDVLEISDGEFAIVNSEFCVTNANKKTLPLTKLKPNVILLHDYRQCNWSSSLRLVGHYSEVHHIFEPLLFGWLLAYVHLWSFSALPTYFNPTY